MFNSTYAMLVNPTQSITDAYYQYLEYFLAKDNATATTYDKYLALSYVVRNYMMEAWIDTQKKYHQLNVRRVYYLSMEYEFGKCLRQNIINMGIEKQINDATRKLGFDLADISKNEDAFELGNSNRGSNAAGMLEAMASAGIPVIGYGIRYDYGSFRQSLRAGQQIEEPYDWLHKGHPWEVIRPEYASEVQFHGQIETPESTDQPILWKNTDRVIAIPYDMPVAGYQNGVVNTLRLWSARAIEEFMADYQNHGDYIRACEDRLQTSRLTSVLFPEENIIRTTELRLKQQFFFISASLQDIIRRYKVDNRNMLDLDKKVAIQIDSNCCALAVPEFMRLLIDIEQIPWDSAWKLTRSVFAFINSAVMREELESCPVYILSQIFPRHMQLIFEINQHYLDEQRMSNPDISSETIRDLSIIEEGEVKRIRMINMATIGSSTVTGVSQIQTAILQKTIMPQFNTQSDCHTPVLCITNGVAIRRWLPVANDPLAQVITRAIGDRWIKNPAELSRLAPLADSSDLQNRIETVKQEAKKRLSAYCREVLKLDISAQSLFDIQCTKIHPNKRQVLHLFGIIARYLNLKSGLQPLSMRVHIFGGKASPTDFLAKQIIHLISMVADVINNDPETRDALRLIFIPGYNMSLAEKIVPAADIYEQIAAPEFEPCGTSAFMFAVNGAHIIASKSGAMPELQLLPDSALPFVFGKSTEELGGIAYNPGQTLAANPQLQEILGFLQKTVASKPSGNAIYPLLSSITDNDRYMVLLDFTDYFEQQCQVDIQYKNRTKWLQGAVKSIAAASTFSTDNTVREFAQKIWKIPLPA